MALRTSSSASAFLATTPTTPSYPPPGDAGSFLSSSLPHLAASPFINTESSSLLPQPESPLPLLSYPTLPSHRQPSSPVTASPTVKVQGKGKEKAP